jgi:hypothetical protein
MNTLPVDFSLNELIFLRQSSDIVSITGKDAKFLTNLQNKLEQGITEINNMMDAKNTVELEKVITFDKERQQAKK